MDLSLLLYNNGLILYNMSMSDQSRRKRHVGAVIAEEDLAALDAYAKAVGCNRSDAIREAIIEFQRTSRFTRAMRLLEETQDQTGSS